MADASRESVEQWKRGPLSRLERAFFGRGGDPEQGTTSPPDSIQSTPNIPAGWFKADGGLRYWDGKGWTERRAPGIDTEPIAKTILWAMSLASGVAGVLAWAAPVIAFYWPLGLGGAGISFAIAARELRGKTPWYAVFAVIAALVAVAIGIAGYSDIEDVRTGLDEFR